MGDIIFDDIIMSFINVFENLLKYNDKTIFIVLDVNNNIWFTPLKI